MSKAIAIIGDSVLLEIKDKVFALVAEEECLFSSSAYPFLKSGYYRGVKGKDREKVAWAKEKVKTADVDKCIKIDKDEVRRALNDLKG